jgi:hypothetical protein
MVRLGYSGPASRSEKITQAMTSVCVSGGMTLEHEVEQTKEGDPPFEKQYSVANIPVLFVLTIPILVLPLSWLGQKFK